MERQTLKRVCDSTAVGKGSCDSTTVGKQRLKRTCDSTALGTQTLKTTCRWRKVVAVQPWLERKSSSRFDQCVVGTKSLLRERGWNASLFPRFGRKTLLWPLAPPFDANACNFPNSGIKRKMDFRDGLDVLKDI